MHRWTLSALALGLAGAAPYAPDAFECDRRVAVGDLAGAREPCARAGRDAGLDALERAPVAEAEALRLPKEAAARTDAALAAAEEAVRARPDDVTAVAYAAHLARAARAAPRKDALPPAARWPLPGLALPRPALPPLTDPEVRAQAEALSRSEARLLDLRRRLASGGNEALRAAEARHVAEAARLREALVAALDDRVTRDPKRPLAEHLHLAAARFDADPARAQRALAAFSDAHPAAPEGRIATLWLAVHAVDAGDVRLAQRLVAIGASADAALAELLKAILAWQAGTAAAEPAGDDRPDLQAQRLALRAVVQEVTEPAAAAATWGTLVDLLDPKAPASGRARLRAAAAWADAVAGGAVPSSVPADLRRPALVHLLGRGRPALAEALFEGLASDEPEAPDLAFIGAALIDALRAQGDDEAADALLARLATRLLAPGPWKQAHGEAGAPVRTRLHARVAPAFQSSIPLPPELRERLGPLVDARLAAEPLPPDGALIRAKALAASGFPDRALAIFKRLRREADSRELAIAAGTATVDSALAAARRLGAEGAPVGPWLDGTPVRPPVPPAVRALVDAQTDLLAVLPSGSPERDGLLVDRATIRAAYGDTASAAEALREVATRRAGSALGLRAALQLLATTKASYRPAEALRLTRANTAPAAWEASLKATWRAAYGERSGDQAATLMNQRLFARAAQTYDGFAAQAAGEVAVQARLAAAVAWTLALHVPEARAAWEAFLEAAPAHPLTPDAMRHLARLLNAAGDRPAAAAAWHALLVRFPEAADEEAIAAVLDLEGERTDRLRELVLLHPERLPALAERLRALEPTVPPRPTTASAGDARLFWPR